MTAMSHFCGSFVRKLFRSQVANAQLNSRAHTAKADTKPFPEPCPRDSSATLQTVSVDRPKGSLR